MKTEDLTNGIDPSKLSEAFKKFIDKVWKNIKDLTPEDQENYLAKIRLMAKEVEEKRKIELN